MSNHTLREVVVTIALITLAVFLLNPFGFWMPDMMVLCLLASAIGLFGVFATFVLREKAADEREEQHQSLAGRNAFLAGAGVLILGIVVEGYTHTVDPWLVIALIVMILVKLGTRMWGDRHL